tara:strand:- start:709 stop:1125 length:417 start_codon:yes stop_codon:yes gene_type:complete
MAYLKKRHTLSSETVLEYEEGTWTPSAGVGTLSNSIWRWYRKMGSMVWVGASVTFPSSTSASNQSADNIPFTALTYSPGYVGYSTWHTSGEPQLFVVVWNAYDKVLFYNRHEALTAANLASARVDFTIAMNIDGPYAS